MVPVSQSSLFALKFLLHLVGDLHQPLHCADNNDRGGNSVKVSQHVDAAYVDQAKTDVALQLSRAGVRLAHVLNEALK